MVVAHGAGGDVMDSDTSLPWDAVCAEVAKLRVGLGEVPMLPTATTIAGDAVVAMAA